jgi:3D (Asp-Asp-Asp) domain-containing protein
VAGCAGGADAARAARDDPRSFQPPEPTASPVPERRIKRITERTPEPPPAAAASASPEPPEPGTALGTFRNTYYNFPSQRNYTGRKVTVFGARCQPLAEVPVTFHDTLCVQGSGSLASGVTLSFARRGCSCARTCPRTGQQICFDTLDRERFPWGRGAAGTAIVPFHSVAVDIAVIPLGTSLFIPELAGLPTQPDGTSPHDGCFVAEDRGIGVVGRHVDVFTGAVEMTRLWDGLVPTNQGVSVYVDSPRCAPP